MLLGCLSNCVRAPPVPLLGNRELHALALGQRDPWLLLANNEDVVLACGKDIVVDVLAVDDVEASVVTLTVGDDTDTTHVATTDDHGNGASVEADKVGDLASAEVNLDRVVDLDGGVRVADTNDKKPSANWGGGRTYNRPMKLNLPKLDPTAE